MYCGKRNIFSGWLLFCLLVILFPSESIAAGREVFFEQYEILKEPIEQISITEAQQSNAFKKTKHLNFGYSTDAYWIKMPLTTGINTKQLYAVSEFRCLDYVDFYLSRNGIISDSLITGYLRPLSTRQKMYSRSIFALPQDISATDTLYVRIQKKEGTLHTRFSLLNEFQLLETNHTEKQMLFFFFGVCFLMLIFSFSYYLYFRKTMFLWYMLFVVSFAIHQLSNFGYGTMYIWKDWLWMSNFSRAFFNVPAALGIVLFSYGLLRVKEFSPKIINKAYRFIIIYYASMLLFPFIPIPTYPFRFAVYTLFIFSVPITLITIIIAAYNSIKKKHLPGYFLLAGEVVLICTMLLFVLRNFQMFPAGFSEKYLSDYSILFMGITSMSFGLISMLTYTKEMHYRIVKEYIEHPKPEPKIYSKEEQEKLSETFSKLDTYFKEHKPFLNAELHLSEVSHQTEIPDHLISKAINFKAEMHFFDFVNSYRIQEATLLLADEEAMKTYTIEALARQCGFSNKTSFNKAFKKFTGQTPTSYRQRQ